MTQIIILAAGKGSRMGSELPKVLVPLNGKLIIYYLMESLKKAEPELKPIVVVSPSNKEIISKALADYDVEYAIQDQQLGTGHAVACARDLVGAEVENILVLYGDHPFLKTDSIKAFLELKPEALTIMPTVLPSFDSWYHNFYAWGRIVRNQAGEVKAIVELKDASEEEKLITEVNPGFMCFNRKWLFENIDKLQDNNKAHEFYLTDMVKIAFNQKHKVHTLLIKPQEAMGINSPEELKIAEGINVSD